MLWLHAALVGEDARRFGDSNATAARATPASSSQSARRSGSRRGRKPTKRYGPSERPLVTSAVSTALGPGRTVTSILVVYAEIVVWRRRDSRTESQGARGSTSRIGRSTS